MNEWMNGSSKIVLNIFRFDDYTDDDDVNFVARGILPVMSLLAQAVEISVPTVINCKINAISRAKEKKVDELGKIAHIFCLFNWSFQNFDNQKYLVI